MVLTKMPDAKPNTHNIISKHIAYHKRILASTNRHTIRPILTKFQIHITQTSSTTRCRIVVKLGTRIFHHCFIGSFVGIAGAVREALVLISVSQLGLTASILGEYRTIVGYGGVAVDGAAWSTANLEILMLCFY